MKHFVGGTFLILALLATAPAQAGNAQQQKMKDCNAQASAKKLSGAERQTFMSQCLKAGGGSSGTQLTAQQQKMKDCNTQAAAQHVAGKDRKAFMSHCLSGQATN